MSEHLIHFSQSCLQPKSTQVTAMFNLFRKDPLQRLNKEYARCLEQARDLQRKGDIQGFAAMSAQAEELLKQLDEIEQPDATHSET
ncbi:MAG: DUF6435 family protein [Fuerstiella sp.]